MLTDKCVFFFNCSFCSNFSVSSSSFFLPVLIRSEALQRHFFKFPTRLGICTPHSIFTTVGSSSLSNWVWLSISGDLCVALNGSEFFKPVLGTRHWFVQVGCFLASVRIVLRSEVNFQLNMQYIIFLYTYRLIKIISNNRNCKNYDNNNL